MFKMPAALPLYMTRKQAIAEGFTHEGTLFGIPHWIKYDPRTEDIAEAATKFAPLEGIVTFCTGMLQFANSFRPEGEEILFAFKVNVVQPLKETSHAQEV